MKYKYKTRETKLRNLKAGDYVIYTMNGKELPPFPVSNGWIELHANPKNVDLKLNPQLKRLPTREENLDVKWPKIIERQARLLRLKQ